MARLAKKTSFDSLTMLSSGADAVGVEVTFDGTEQLLWDLGNFKGYQTCAVAITVTGGVLPAATTVYMGNATDGYSSWSVSGEETITLGVTTQFAFASTFPSGDFDIKIKTANAGTRTFTIEWSFWRETFPGLWHSLTNHTGLPGIP